MARFNLNLRNANAGGETPIHLVIRWDNQRIVVNTGQTANPKQWDKQAQRLDTATNNPKRLVNRQVNALLSGRVAEAERLFTEFQTIHKRKPNGEELLSILNEAFCNKPAISKDKTGLFDFMESLLNEMATGLNPKTGKPYARQTPNTYRQCLTQLRDYGQSKRKRIDFDTITLDFYMSFYDYLINKKGFRLNYVGKIIKTLKTFMNEAIERNLTNNIAHKGRRFTAPREKVSNIYLTRDELTAMYKLDLSKEPRLEHVRDLFLFGCFTGLRFSDYSKVKPEYIDFKGGIIDIPTQKTDELVSIPILPIAKAILTKYRGKTANSLPDSISNQKFNKYLKEVAVRLPELQNIITDEYFIHGKKISRSFHKWQKVSTHTARRSFATNMILEGVPSQMVMKITGHRTESAFQTYLKMSPRDNAKLLLQGWEQKFAINQ
jgi:integrase